jgi:hypothetical protein
MNWLSVITGLFRPAKELVEVFRPNAEMEAARGHEETMALSQQDLAALRQFAAEFHSRERRTWWDSLVDGLNRLPRPLITLGILAFFVLAPLEPVRFLEVAKVYELMPDGFWALLSVIVAFYFGGRMQLRQQDMAAKGGAMLVAREMLARRRVERVAEERAGPPPQASMPAEPLDAGPANRVVEEWRRRQAGIARN